MEFTSYENSELLQLFERLVGIIFIMEVFNFFYCNILDSSFSRKEFNGNHTILTGSGFMCYSDEVGPRPFSIKVRLAPD